MAIDGHRRVSHCRKVGLGKSTLMKYLYGHRRVREELQIWAGNTELVVASFFFWRRGTLHQRSLSGLLRSLLYDVLRQRPDLIPDVFPNVGYLTQFELEHKEIQAAFYRLAHCSSLYDTTKFCFFIDGLDEYEETLRDDYRALVQLLLLWTQAAPHGIKLCVSSREYSVFLNIFSDDKRLRLQDLTLADMKSHVRERLKDLDEEHLAPLVDVITEKATGIFLWVALVVKSIRARLEDD
ncbi:hypothetical protein N658DRAFT_82975 [Parathielavia hyrcaniae]|uniref:Nephrocystin 3-like N-terminal domain-containing protein n=1 Tax=Parathielavia hyrcaniae TaxID=113614 RepID=A0AAN6T1H0_9PEZI|nr:hypothetical protein N658DRAFT_82975 [Parathielavia hyrcaniae]